MKKETIISLIITLVVGLVTFYIFLPPINIHSLGFLTYLLFLLIVFTIFNSLGSIISRRKFKDVMFAPKYLVIGCIIIFSYIFIKILHFLFIPLMPGAFSICLKISS